MLPSDEPLAGQRDDRDRAEARDAVVAVEAARRRVSRGLAVPVLMVRHRAVPAWALHRHWAGQGPVRRTTITPTFTVPVRNAAIRKPAIPLHSRMAAARKAT